MKSVLIIGSRRFYDEIEDYKHKLNDLGIKAFTPQKPRGDLTPEQEMESTLRFWRLVKSCDIIYVYSREGYIGDTVKAQIGYTYACSRELVASEYISDKFSRETIGENRIMDLEQLIKYSLNGSNNRNKVYRTQSDITIK